MSQFTPRVTGILLAYDCAEFIRGALRSVLAQDAEPMQLIVSDEIEGGQFFNGLRPQRAHAQAYDLDSRRRLRDLSRRLTGEGPR